MLDEKSASFSEKINSFSKGSWLFINAYHNVHFFRNVGAEGVPSAQSRYDRIIAFKDGGGYFRICFFFSKKKTESSWDVKKVFSMSFKDFYMIFCAKES